MRHDQLAFLWFAWMEFTMDANRSINMNDQPTEPQPKQEPVGAGFLHPPVAGSQAVMSSVASPAGNLTRRTFMGKSLAAIAAKNVAGVPGPVGGAAFEQ